MLPALESGQKVITFNWSKEYKVGDLVVIKLEKREIVKRLKGIKKDQVFVIGDNEKYSTDSRALGWIDREKLVGKVIYNL